MNSTLRITKNSSQTALLLLLVTAFLSMQWTTIHIHLAEHHTHEGSHHEHQIESHSNHLTNQYASTIDSDYQADHENTVELDQDCCSQYNGKQTPSPIGIITSVFQSQLQSSVVSSKILVIVNTKLSYLARTTVQLRAPPRIS
jgi:hypothetical protein